MATHPHADNGDRHRRPSPGLLAWIVYLSPIWLPLGISALLPDVSEAVAATLMLIGCLVGLFLSARMFASRTRGRDEFDD